MTTTKALEILKHHNTWRRGIVDDPKYTPKEIGEAIDVAIKHLEYVEKIKEINANFKLNEDITAVITKFDFGTTSTTNDKCPNYEKR
jgi:hypothetical protein